MHVFATITHGANRIREVQRARGNVRGIFTQAVAGDEGGRDAFFAQHPEGGDGNRKNRRLRDLSELQLLFRPLEA